MYYPDTLHIIAVFLFLLVIFGVMVIWYFMTR